MYIMSLHKTRRLSHCTKKVDFVTEGAAEVIRTRNACQCIQGLLRMHKRYGLGVRIRYGNSPRWILKF